MHAIDKIPRRRFNSLRDLKLSTATLVSNLHIIRNQVDRQPQARFDFVYSL